MPTINTECLFISEYDLNKLKDIETLLNRALEKDDITDHDRIVLATKIHHFKDVVCHKQYKGTLSRIYDAFYQPDVKTERSSQSFITELLRYHRSDCIGVNS